MDDELSATERRALDAWAPIEVPANFADRVLDAREADARELDPVRKDRREPGARELDPARRDQRDHGRRGGVRVAAIIGACVAVAAVVALVLTRRGPDAERSTPVVEPAARPPAPTPAPVAATGIRVESALPFEIRAPYKTTWVAADPGVREVVPGSGLRFRGAPAKVHAFDTTVEIQGAAVVQIDSPLTVHLETGSIVVRATALVATHVAGGSIMLDGPGEAELIATATETTIATVFGSVRVQAKHREHVAAIGDVVTLDPKGAIVVARSSPTEADVKVEPTGAITIHDPQPPTAVQFRLGATCPGRGIVELSKDGRFLDIQRGGRDTFANLLVDVGTWTYRVRCMANGVIGAQATAGKIHVLRDAGTRALPPTQPAVNRIDADGRNYRISYDSVIPTVEFHAKGRGSRFTLHVARDDREEVFHSQLPTVLVPGTKLRDGQYTYWFESDGTKDASVSTLTIDFDDTAPQLRIDSPVNGSFTAAQSAPIAVRGFAAPGWALSFDGNQLLVEVRGRFAAEVPAPRDTPLVLRAEHASRGTHYYLRRPRPVKFDFSK